MRNKKKLFSRIIRFFQNFKNDGIIQTSVRIILKITNSPNEIQKSKSKVLNHLIKIHGHKVVYGKFKGMKLNKNSYWSKNDLITHILGVYEYHILEQLIKFSKINNSVFIDIGAADGYFAVGGAYSGLFKKVYAFETHEEGRKSLIENAKSNYCETNVLIKSKANFDSLKDLIDIHKSTVILIDIEGDEFNLLNYQTLKLLSNCNIIIELHPDLVNNGYEKKKDLINFSKSFFNVSIIKREIYNPNLFEELDQFTDEERLIAFSEGRENNMSWLVLEPKNKNI